MTTRTGIELHGDFCRLVEIDRSASRWTAGREVRVRRFLTRISSDPQSPDFSRLLRDIRSEQRLAREATVVVWGLRSSHQIVRVPQAADADLESLAIAEAKEEIALLEVDGTQAAIASTIGADVRAGSDPRREVSLTAASSSDLARRVQPIVEAGFEVVRVVTPAMALCAIARAREDAVPGASVMYAVLTAHATCVAIVRDGLLLLAREFAWGHTHGTSDSGEAFDTRLAAELRRSMLFFRQSSRTPVDAIVLSGDFAHLRTLTGPLRTALAVPVETLDSLTGIDAGSVPEPADVFRAEIAALRLAIATADEAPPYANLLPARPRASYGPPLTRFVAAAVVALLLAVTWFGMGRWSSPRPASLLASTSLDPRVASLASPALPVPPAIVVDAETPESLPLEREIVVSSILYSAERRFALVDGRIAGIGDRIGSGTIVAIEPRAIVVESAAHERRTIELQTAARARGVR